VILLIIPPPPKKNSNSWKEHTEDFLKLLKIFNSL
jgi:hypothetical protein